MLKVTRFREGLNRSVQRSDARTRPYPNRLLEPANALCRLLDEQREVSARMARFRPRLLHQFVADHDGASEFAGQRLEPARRIHRGADHGEFEPVQSDIAEHDLAVVQSDADLDRRLAAAARSRFSSAIDSIMACAQRSAFRRRNRR